MEFAFNPGGGRREPAALVGRGQVPAHNDKENSRSEAESKNKPEVGEFSPLKNSPATGTAAALSSRIPIARKIFAPRAKTTPTPSSRRGSLRSPLSPIIDRWKNSDKQNMNEGQSVHHKNNQATMTIQNQTAQKRCNRSQRRRSVSFSNPKNVKLSLTLNQSESPRERFQAGTGSNSKGSGTTRSANRRPFGTTPPPLSVSGRRASS